MKRAAIILALREILEDSAISRDKVQALIDRLEGTQPSSPLKEVSPVTEPDDDTLSAWFDSLFDATARGVDK